MKKWTTTLHAAAPASSPSSVSLNLVLETRRGPLNEVEAWAVLAQTAHALQDNLLRINGGFSGGSSDNNYDTVLVTPRRLMFTQSGRIFIDHSREDRTEHEYEREDLRRGHRLQEQELESLGLYSLGRTVSHSLRYNREQEVSPQLSELVSQMSSTPMSLLHLLERVSQHWQRMVGSSPLSRFVSQLFRVTSVLNGEKSGMFFNSSSSSSSVALTNHDSRSNIILSSGCVLSDG